MFIAAPLSVADRFALIVEGLCRVVAARGGRGVMQGGRDLTLGPLVLLLVGRLRRMAARFASIAARVRAGTLRAPRLRASVRRPCDTGRQRLPEGFAWLVRMAPETASFGTQLQYLLADAEMAALVAAVPRIGRILRPLCRMLAVAPTPELLPPPPRRSGGEVKPAVDPPSLAAVAGPDFETTATGPPETR